jgi:AbrB family looped-hinge helix DNA binding protein
MSNTVEVGRSGRIVLPKEIREKYDINENSRLIIRQRQGEIILIPVKKCKNPTEALSGSIKLDEPIDEPWEVVKGHLKKGEVEL